MGDDVKSVSQRILDRAADQIGTHSANCHEYHLPCFAAFVMRELTAATSAPSVDREALAREMYAADFWGDENAHRDWDELIAHPVHFERYRARADALIASGILRDVRNVQAEALEQAAGNFPFPQDPYGGFHHESLRAAFVQGTNWLRERAQAIREARNER